MRKQDLTKPDRSTFTTYDFLQWREAKALRLAPKFQRRGVWTTPARSYFIDTLIRGLPVPPIYLRVTQAADHKSIVREVVDGQQRIAATMDFVDGQYALSKNLDATYAGLTFDDLTLAQQSQIREYGFPCVVFSGISDAQVLEIFARLNTYSVSLNAQELRNGKYFGKFKQAAYRLARQELEFWRGTNLFSERNIARMLEVEFTSELMIAQIAGMQDKKKSISDFYEEFDEKFPDQTIVQDRFSATLDTIADVMYDRISETEFRRTPLFYSLHCAVYHRMYGLPELDLPTPKKRLNLGEKSQLRNRVEHLSDVLLAARAEEEYPKKYAPFVKACLSQTDNLHPRQIRTTRIYADTFS